MVVKIHLPPVVCALKNDENAKSRVVHILPQFLKQIKRRQQQRQKPTMAPHCLKCTLNFLVRYLRCPQIPSPITNVLLWSKPQPRSLPACPSRTFYHFTAPTFTPSDMYTY